MRQELIPGAWVEHAAGFVPAAEAAAWLAALSGPRAAREPDSQVTSGQQADLRWEQREIVLFGRRVLQPRLIAWAGELPYRYSGQTLPPRPFTAGLADLVAQVAARQGVPFNHLLANRYRDGQDSMGFHADDEPELGADPVVATLSFGATRQLVLVGRRKRDGERRRFALAAGDLFVMGGTCQRHYHHGIPKEPSVLAERISLTLRHILRPPPG